MASAVTKEVRKLIEKIESLTGWRTATVEDKGQVLGLLVGDEAFYKALEAEETE